MQSHKSLRPLRRSRNFRNRQRRSIARENRVRRAQSVECRKQLSLRRQLLDDCLNHQITVLQILNHRRTLQPSANLAFHRLGDRSLLHKACQILLNPLQSLVHKLRRHFPHHCFKSSRRAHLRDPRPHQPTPNHAHFLNRHVFLADTAVEPLRRASKVYQNPFWSAAARRAFPSAVSSPEHSSEAQSWIALPCLTTTLL